MLDKGFENDIRSIIEKTAPTEKRQTLMCMSDLELMERRTDRLL
jgi:superfamily II DNA/RNA helicase